MEAKFNLEFSKLVKQKHHIHLPSSATYDTILAVLKKHRNGEKVDSNSGRQYVSRYRLVESNGFEKLYKDNQEVVKQEEANSPFQFPWSIVPRLIPEVCLALLWKPMMDSIASEQELEFSIKNTLGTKSIQVRRNTSRWKPSRTMKYRCALQLELIH
ncbi:hypothetical protein Ddc_05365 [Ditylenchus destructor]|nr:hypothetical protein Ddc_05365 [Ditylenchus destructor]